MGAMAMTSMTRLKGAILASAILASISGCSTYPTPDDVARTSTFDIVQRVRCEAKAGLARFRFDDVHAQAIIAGTTIGYDFQFVINETNDTEAGALKPGAAAAGCRPHQAHAGR